MPSCIWRWVQNIGQRGWQCTLPAQPFIFTITAMVSNHLSNEPQRPNDRRSAKDEYGCYKIRREDAIQAANPNAIIVRQINPNSIGNNMVTQIYD
jgi:dTDP-4-dehydrorhamnose reductase